MRASGPEYSYISGAVLFSTAWRSAARSICSSAHTWVSARPRTENRASREEVLARTVPDTNRSSANSTAHTGRTAQRNTRRSEEHTSELQSRFDLVCRLLLEKKN